LIPVEEGDANGLFNELEAALQKDGIGWKKVVGCWVSQHFLKRK